jgi:hypothetical protein
LATKPEDFNPEFNNGIGLEGILEYLKGKTIIDVESGDGIMTIHLEKDTLSIFALKDQKQGVGVRLERTESN